MTTLLVDILGTLVNQWSYVLLFGRGNSPLDRALDQCLDL